MTEYSTPSPLTTLPLRKFEHFRVSTYDAPPVPLLHPSVGGSIEEVDANDDTDADGASPSTASIIPCRVCHQNISRYTCPRCAIPYCSVACYQSHSNSESDADNTVSSSSCTEGFYQERVQSIVQLEQKAKRDDTHAILNRTYQQQQQQQLMVLGDEEGGDSNDERTEEDMMKLLELLSLLEEQDDDDDETNQQLSGNEQQQQQHQKQQQISKLLSKSPRLKAEFEAAVERGDVLPLVLEPWNPWWRPVLVSSSSDHTDTIRSSSGRIEEEMEESNTQTIDNTNNIETLDERLLNVKPFQSLSSSKTTTMPDLTYNLLEVLYCIAWSLRLYHGSHNATSDPETALEAAEMIVSTSSVLSDEDARYTNLEEVMNRLAETTVRKSDPTMTPSWTILGHDVAFLVSNPRYMGRALLEALDILKAAIGYLKKKDKTMTKQRQPATPPPTTSSTTTTTELVHLRRKRKKMEFFLSWSQDSWARAGMPDMLSDDIRAWVEHWKPAAGDKGDGNGDDNDVVLETLLAPKNQQARPLNTAARQEAPSSRPPEPFVQELTTTRKIEMLD